MRLQNPMLVEEVINLLIKGNPRSQFAITVKNVILIYPYFISFLSHRTYVRSTYLVLSLTKTSVKRRLFVQAPFLFNLTLLHLLRCAPDTCHQGWIANSRPLLQFNRVLLHCWRLKLGRGFLKNAFFTRSCIFPSQQELLFRVRFCLQPWPYHQRAVLREISEVILKIGSSGIFECSRRNFRRTLWSLSL